MAFRQEKVCENIKDLAAKFFGKNLAADCLITVTNASASEDGRYVTIYLSVFPAEKESQALEFVSKKQKDFYEDLKSKIKMRVLPHVKFELDKGEKNRQRIDELLKEAE